MFFEEIHVGVDHFVSASWKEASEFVKIFAKLLNLRF